MCRNAIAGAARRAFSAHYDSYFRWDKVSQPFNLRMLTILNLDSIIAMMRMQHMMSSQKLGLSILMSGSVTFFILLIRPLHFQGYRPQSTDEFWNVELLILSYHARLLGTNTLQRQCISRSTNWSVDFLMGTFATSSCNAAVVDI